MRYDIWKAPNTSAPTVAEDSHPKLLALGIEAATFNAACEKWAAAVGESALHPRGGFTPGNDTPGFHHRRPRLGHCRLFATQAEAANPDGFRGLQLRTLADKWTGAACTLNGHAARVTGRLNECATIAALDNLALHADFSWEAVDRVMQADRAFNVQ